MESHPRISPAEARAALESVSDAKKALAPHTRSPAWLYPALGLASAALVSGIALSTVSSGATSIVAAAVIFLAVLPSIPGLERKARFDAFSHPRNTATVSVYFAVLLLITAAALALSSLPWAIALAALAAMMWTVAIGTILDARLERALRNGQ